MPNIDAAILNAVESFVEQLEGLIRQAALESVHAALNGGSATPRRGAKLERTAKVLMPKGSKKSAKRTPEELDALVKKFHAYVGKNPGQRIEQIGIGLGVSTKTLVLPVKKLHSEKQIGTKGQKRATTYFAK
jgi:hypothetical protein